MESLHSAIERIKSPPYDFVLVKRVQEESEENEYTAGGIKLMKNTITGLIEEELYFYEMGKLSPGTFKLPKGEVYDPPAGIKQCDTLFNDGEIRRAKREAGKAEKLYEKYKTPATEDRFNYYKEIYVYFDTWYHENDLDLPEFNVKPAIVYSILTIRKDVEGRDYVEFLYDETGFDLPDTDRAKDGGKPRRGDKYPYLDSHKKEIFPTLLDDLFIGKHIPVKQIYPNNTIPDDPEEAKHIEDAFKNVVYKDRRHKERKESRIEKTYDTQERTEVFVYILKSS